MNTSAEPRRAFVSHSARASVSVEPILSRTESLLHGLGWRTRLPRRPLAGTIGVDERRRLREESYAEIERADLVLHVLAPGSLGGLSLSRELHRAVQAKRPLYLLECEDWRREFGIDAPAPERLAHLVQETGGTVLRLGGDLHRLLSGWPGTIGRG